MARLLWAVLCRRIIVDQPTGAISYIDALEGIGSAHYPAPAPPIIAGTLWLREGEDEHRLEVKVSILSPEEVLIVADSAVVELEKSHRRARIHIGFGGFQIQGPGQHFVLIEVKDGKRWKEHSRIPFDVEMIPAQQGTANQH
ncbi:MAG: hypothetical protein SGI90_11950 [Candidatus Eisenbacteria bacterium]|nr:hypothetical protein [Candidatus Eisenbacteria bacterium]